MYGKIVIQHFTFDILNRFKMHKIFMSKKHWTNVEDISAYLHVLLVPDIEYQRQ
jgi:hypothetical protein